MPARLAGRRSGRDCACHCEPVTAPIAEQIKKARKRRFRAFFPSPVVAPVMVPVIIRPAIVGVGPRAIVMGRPRPVIVTRSVIIRAGCGERARRYGARGKPERQPRTDATMPMRLRRRSHGRRAQGGSGRQNCQCPCHSLAPFANALHNQRKPCAMVSESSCVDRPLLTREPRRHA